MNPKHPTDIAEGDSKLIVQKDGREHIVHLILLAPGLISSESPGPYANGKPLRRRGEVPYDPKTSKNETM